MRVLAVCNPSPGHINPLLPLLSALTEQGDEVVVASGSDIAAAVSTVGARHFPAGRGFEAWFGDLAARTRGAPGDGLPPERISAYFLPRLFAEIATADMVDSVIEAGRQTRADLVMYETEAFVGPLAASVLGVPAVHHQVGFLPDAEVCALVADALSPMWVELGQPMDRTRAVTGDLLIRTSPKTLESMTEPVNALPLRPTPLPTAAPAAGDSTPLVHLTLGTFHNKDLDVFRTVMEALADEPVELLVTVGTNNDPAALNPVPSHVRVEQYVPHAELLPQCRAVIHHGGAGTMYAGLAHGLPQVVIPQGADQFINAETLERAGVGVGLAPQDVQVERVRQAAMYILHDRDVRARAQQIAEEIAAMPDARAVASQLRTVQW
jgi:UDP:flavonoid glycosyltransferase YjiC (YdhE family)